MSSRSIVSDMTDAPNGKIVCTVVQCPAELAPGDHFQWMKFAPFVTKVREAIKNGYVPYVAAVFGIVLHYYYILEWVEPTKSFVLFPYSERDRRQWGGKQFEGLKRHLRDDGVNWIFEGEQAAPSTVQLLTVRATGAVAALNPKTKTWVYI